METKNLKSLESLVEEYFGNPENGKGCFLKTPTKAIVAENYFLLGQLTALRFLEWIEKNPEGVVALPTGKTPEYFIKWVQYYLGNWEKEIDIGTLSAVGFQNKHKPPLKGLTFVQLDEFFPMDPKHHRSFNFFVRKFYLDGFGMDANKALLIDTYHIQEQFRKRFDDYPNYESLFPDGKIDFDLRNREPQNHTEALQKEAFLFWDQYCDEYEFKIQERGGIGFFLGGIGPDGHIAFNIRGSSHYSQTRLTQINYETMATAAEDLGGIEMVRKKAVVTIGLRTITLNPDATAIIMAAGQSKAKIVARGVEGDVNVHSPATCLRSLPNARFYLTNGSASELKTYQLKLLTTSSQETGPLFNKIWFDSRFKENNVTSQHTLPAEAHLNELLNQKDWTAQVQILKNQLVQNIQKGTRAIENERIFHTAPHHDDIELSYLPLVHHIVRNESNKNYFCYCTSGFTSITNQYTLERLNNLYLLCRQGALNNNELKMDSPEDWQEDLEGYLQAVSTKNEQKKEFFQSRRLLRHLLVEEKNHIQGDLLNNLENLIHLATTIPHGEKVPEVLQHLKGWIREWEAELVWAHFGISRDKVSHARLKFYTGELFPDYPEEGDVLTLYNEMERIKPTIVTLAMDPEGSGPDTHFKTLVALGKAVELYSQNYPDEPLKIWGYRNIWSRFHPLEGDIIVPVSLNSFAVLDHVFKNCFESQKSASFPSYEWDGAFSELAQKIWADQLTDLTKILNENFFYKSGSPLLRRTYGAVYLREFNLEDFLKYLEPIWKMIDSGRILKQTTGV